MCFEFEASAGTVAPLRIRSKVGLRSCRDPPRVPRPRPARRLLRPHRGHQPAPARGRAAAARRRRPQLRAVPAPGPARRLADGQPPHDRPGRRRRLQPQRPDLPGRPAREERAWSRARPPPDDERGITVTITDAGRALLAKVFPGHIEVVEQLALRAALARRRSRRSPACWRRCATTCARRRPAQPRRSPPTALTSTSYLPGAGRTSMPYSGAFAMARPQPLWRSASLSGGAGEERRGAGVRDHHEPRGRIAITHVCAGDTAPHAGRHSGRTTTPPRRAPTPAFRPSCPIRRSQSRARRVM